MNIQTKYSSQTPQPTPLSSVSNVFHQIKEEEKIVKKMKKRPAPSINVSHSSSPQHSKRRKVSSSSPLESPWEGKSAEEEQEIRGEEEWEDALLSREEGDDGVWEEDGAEAYGDDDVMKEVVAMVADEGHHETSVEQDENSDGNHTHASKKRIDIASQNILLVSKIMTQIRRQEEKMKVRMGKENGEKENRNETQGEKETRNRTVRDVNCDHCAPCAHCHQGSRVLPPRSDTVAPAFTPPPLNTDAGQPKASRKTAKTANQIPKLSHYRPINRENLGPPRTTMPPKPKHKKAAQKWDTVKSLLDRCDESGNLELRIETACDRCRKGSWPCIGPKPRKNGKVFGCDCCQKLHCSSSSSRARGGVI